MIKVKDIEFSETSQGFIAEWYDELGVYHKIDEMMDGNQSWEEVKRETLNYANAVNKLFKDYLKQGYSPEDIEYMYSMGEIDIPHKGKL